MHRDRESSSTVGTAITFLLIGLGIGAAVGLLYAPQAGKQTRKELRRRYEDARDIFDDWKEDAKEVADEIMDRGSEFADEIRERITPLAKAVRKG